jgi:hypothetical protein
MLRIAKHRHYYEAYMKLQNQGHNTPEYYTFQMVVDLKTSAVASMNDCRYVFSPTIEKSLMVAMSLLEGMQSFPALIPTENMTIFLCSTALVAYKYIHKPPLPVIEYTPPPVKHTTGREGGAPWEFPPLTVSNQSQF